MKPETVLTNACTVKGFGPKRKKRRQVLAGLVKPKKGALGLDLADYCRTGDVVLLLLSINIKFFESGGWFIA
ncbi:MAG: hypothetical protein CM15mP120_22990 [Pseudomonadota bacterium]|nr:MAG: hypothetical protein CM15mP120_22990 [Pseudomonadota bacterium]